MTSDGKLLFGTALHKYSLILHQALGVVELETTYFDSLLQNSAIYFYMYLLREPNGFYEKNGAEQGSLEFEFR